jgi:hypothetical protein
MYRALIGEEDGAPARTSWARIIAACAGGLALVGCGGTDLDVADGGQDLGSQPDDDGYEGHDDGTCTDGTGMFTGTSHDTTLPGHETATASCTATGSNGSWCTGTRDTTGTKDSCTMEGGSAA